MQRIRQGAARTAGRTQIVNRLRPMVSVHRAAFAATSAASPPSSASSSSSSSASAAAALTPTQRIHKDIAYCKQQVQSERNTQEGAYMAQHSHDNDQYLCSLLLPPAVRAGVHVLRAFNLELAAVAARHGAPTVGGGESASPQEVFGEENKQKAALAAKQALYEDHQLTAKEEQQIRVGLMKLQWWRDGLESALDNVQSLQLHRPAASHMHTAEAGESSIAAHAQPVLNMLAISIKQYRLTTRWLSRMIEAREKAMVEGQPADINALLAYAESTSSALIYLTLECMGIRNVHADHAASHIGKAMGIALTLRSLPYNAANKQIFIPKTIIQDQRVDLSTVLAGENSPELSNCVFELASLAKSHVEHARQLLPQVPAEARPALVSAVLCDRFLDRLEKYNFDVFHPELGLLPTAPKDAADPQKEASASNVSLSGSGQGFQPLLLRMELLKHQWKGTY